MAGGLLAELILTGNIAIGDGRISVLNGPPPSEPVAKQVYGRLLTEPNTTDVRVWLAFFAEISIGLVTERLSAGGWIASVEQRRLLRRGRSITYRPIDRSQAAWRAIRLAEQLARRRPLDLPDVALAGLVTATEFIHVVLWNHPVDTCRAHLACQLNELRARRPGLHELLAHVHALAGNATLSPRL